MYRQLRDDLADDDGKCVICHQRDATEIDHMQANDILADGRRRKGKPLSSITSYADLVREVARNTAEDGTVLLQSLCGLCHGTKTHGERSVKKLSPRQALFRLFVNTQSAPTRTVRRPSRRRSCSIWITCTSRTASAASAMHKVTTMLAMVSDAAQYTLDDLPKELAKCQMLHRDCHKRRTKGQHDSDSFRRLYRQHA